MTFNESGRPGDWGDWRGAVNSPSARQLWVTLPCKQKCSSVRWSEATESPEPQSRGHLSLFHLLLSKQRRHKCMQCSQQMCVCNDDERASRRLLRIDLPVPCQKMARELLWPLCFRGQDPGIGKTMLLLTFRCFHWPLSTVLGAWKRGILFSVPELILHLDRILNVHCQRYIQYA